MFNYNLSTHPNDVKSVRTNDRRTEPDLFIWRLFVEDVCSVMGQFDGQNTVSQGRVTTGKRLVVFNEFTEPVVDALQGLIGHLQIGVAVNYSRTIQPATTMSK